jgi:hypothetical protein
MEEELLTDSWVKAIAIAALIRAALKNGVRHFDSKGFLLPTEKEIIESLLLDGAVECDDRETTANVTVEEMVEEVRKEWSDRIQ